LKTGFYGVPVLDGGLAHAPAKEDYLVVETAGKIEQAGFDVLYLDADGIDLGEAFADALQVGFHLGALRGYAAHVDFHTARDVDASRQLGQAGLDLLRCLLAFDGALEQRLQHREQGLRFFEGESFHRNDLIIGYDGLARGKWSKGGSELTHFRRGRRQEPLGGNEAGQILEERR